MGSPPGSSRFCQTCSHTARSWLKSVGHKEKDINVGEAAVMGCGGVGGGRAVRKWGARVNRGTIYRCEMRNPATTTNNSSNNSDNGISKHTRFAGFLKDTEIRHSFSHKRVDKASNLRKIQPHFRCQKNWGHPSTQTQIHLQLDAKVTEESAHQSGICPEMLRPLQAY